MTQRSATTRTAKVFRKARLSKGLSIPELAAAAGLARTTIDRIEAGEHAPQMRTARALADALGVPVERLVVLK